MLRITDNQRTSRTLRRIAGWWALVLGSVLLAGVVRAQSAPLTEYAVKAALLFNIAKYADWPPDTFSDPSAPIIIGVLGNDPFGEVLDQVVRGRSINGHAIEIRRADGIAELKGAHLVFVSPSEPHAAQECAALESANVLTVGDTAQTASFTAFAFAVDGDRIVFSVDLDRTNRIGVKISSRLLNLAKTVKRPAEAKTR